MTEYLVLCALSRASYNPCSVTTAGEQGYEETEEKILCGAAGVEIQSSTTVIQGETNPIEGT